MEEESFNDVMGHAPVYSSGLPGVSVTNPAEFKEWHGRVRRAHEREVDALRGETYLDAVSDSVLVKHGLVRLPVDADGVPWTGGEYLYKDRHGDTHACAELVLHPGGWVLACSDGVCHLPEDCRHADEPADPHAELADELDRMVPHIDDGDYADALREYAEGLAREMGEA